MGNNRKNTAKETILYGLKVICRDILEMVALTAILFSLFFGVFYAAQKIHKCKGAECTWEFCPHNGFLLFGGGKSVEKTPNEPINNQN